MLHDEFLWFIDNQDALVKQYSGKYLVIRDQRVIGAYNTLLEAYFGAQRGNPLGTFLIQKCDPGPSAYTAILSPQVAPA